MLRLILGRESGVVVGEETSLLVVVLLFRRYFLDDLIGTTVLVIDGCVISTIVPKNPVVFWGLGRLEISHVATVTDRTDGMDSNLDAVFKAVGQTV